MNWKQEELAQELFEYVKKKFPHITFLGYWERPDGMVYIEVASPYRKSSQESPLHSWAGGDELLQSEIPASLFAPRGRYGTRRQVRNDKGVAMHTKCMATLASPVRLS